MNPYDLVIQLGSQVHYMYHRYSLAPHTKMRTEASAIVLKTGIAPRLMILGGSNFGVRYSDTDLIRPSDFSFEAFAEANYQRKSEAAVIKDVLVDVYNLPSQKIFTETLSATTEENAEFAKIILQRRPMFTGEEKIAVLTLLYHMERVLPVFERVGLEVEPLFAENVLARYQSLHIERICEYYSVPKGGKQYPVEEIRKLLTEGRSLGELMG